MAVQVRPDLLFLRLDHRVQAPHDPPEAERPVDLDRHPVEMPLLKAGQVQGGFAQGLGRQGAGVQVGPGEQRREEQDPGEGAEAEPGPQAPPPPAHNGPAFWIKASAQQDGTVTVTNQRNGFSKTYAAKP